MVVWRGFWVVVLEGERIHHKLVLRFENSLHLLDGRDLLVFMQRPQLRDTLRAHLQHSRVSGGRGEEGGEA